MCKIGLPGQTNRHTVERPPTWNPGPSTVGVTGTESGTPRSLRIVQNLPKTQGVTTKCSRETSQRYPEPLRCTQCRFRDLLTKNPIESRPPNHPVSHQPDAYRLGDLWTTHQRALRDHETPKSYLTQASKVQLMSILEPLEQGRDESISRSAPGNTTECSRETSQRFIFRTTQVNPVPLRRFLDL